MCEHTAYIFDIKRGVEDVAPYSEAAILWLQSYHIIAFPWGKVARRKA